jgi:hypothetical protein
MIARGQHAGVLQKDSVLAVFNAHIEMYNKGFMRLVVDRWSDVKSIADVDATLLSVGHVNADTVVPELDRSKQEWVLQ